MNVIRNYNDKYIGCALLEFQLASIHTRQMLRGWRNLTIIGQSLLFVELARFYNRVD